MKIAINGFGRIGRIFFRQAFSAKGGSASGGGRPDFDIVAINDLGSVENLAYLLKYDSVYGRFNKEVKADVQNKKLIVDGTSVNFFQEKEPAKLPWQDLKVDIIVESTGVFTSYEKAKPHLEAGAKLVVITAPAKDEGETKVFTPNVGMEFVGVGNNITSNASCTTNAITPVAAVMMEDPGVKKAILNTVHGYTSSQGLVDSPSAKDFRRGRAAAWNIVPSTTGAAKAAEKAIPAIKSKFDGIALRVPVLSGSVIDFTFVSGRKTSAEEINDIFKKAAAEPKWQGILKTTEEPLVSSDILGEPYGSIVDLAFTRVVDGDLVKVLSWYDNEWGYAAMLIKHIETLKKFL